MMTRQRAVILAVACFVLGAGAAAWVTFLVHEGLDKADKLSSVVGVLLTVGFGVAGLWAARRDPASTAAVPQRAPQYGAAAAPVAPQSAVGGGSPSGTPAVTPASAAAEAAAGPAAPSSGSRGSIFNVHAKTAYNADQMTVYHRDDD